MSPRNNDFYGKLKYSYNVVLHTYKLIQYIVILELVKIYGCRVSFSFSYCKLICCICQPGTVIETKRRQCGRRMQTNTCGFF